jgi:hypothetical protein
VRQRSIVERFWEKVDRRADDECWPWIAGTTVDGYGALAIGTPSRRYVRAHRFSLMLHLGMFDRRLLVLHDCDNPSCVNPAHLRLGTQFDNMRDMSAKGRGAGQKLTHCKYGHEFTPDNTLISGPGWRACKTCSRERSREWDRARRNHVA